MRWSRRETRLEDVTAHTIKALSRPNGPELVFGPDLARSWALARQDASAQAEPGEYEERRKAGEAGGIAGSLGRNFHRKRVAVLHYRLVSLADDLQAGGVGSASSPRGGQAAQYSCTPAATRFDEAHPYGTATAGRVDAPTTAPGSTTAGTTFGGAAHSSAAAVAALLSSPRGATQPPSRAQISRARVEGAAAAAAGRWRERGSSDLDSEMTVGTVVRLDGIEYEVQYVNTLGQLGLRSLDRHGDVQYGVEKSAVTLVQTSTARSGQRGPDDLELQEEAQSRLALADGSLVHSGVMAIDSDPPGPEAHEFDIESSRPLEYLGGSLLTSPASANFRHVAPWVQVRLDGAATLPPHQAQLKETLDKAKKLQQMLGNVPQPPDPDLAYEAKKLQQVLGNVPQPPDPGKVGQPMALESGAQSAATSARDGAQSGAQSARALPVGSPRRVGYVPAARQAPAARSFSAREPLPTQARDSAPHGGPAAGPPAARLLSVAPREEAIRRGGLVSGMLPGAANLSLAPHAPIEDPLGYADRYERLRARVAPPEATNASAAAAGAVAGGSRPPSNLFGRLKNARKALRLANEGVTPVTWRKVPPEPMPPVPPLPAALTPRAQALARTLDMAATAASARTTPRSCTFGEGPLGLSLADYGDIVVVANEPAPGSQAHANGILRLSVVVGVNHESVSGLFKDALVEKVKACGRPLTLQFLPPN